MNSSKTRENAHTFRIKTETLEERGDDKEKEEEADDEDNESSLQPTSIFEYEQPTSSNKITKLCTFSLPIESKKYFSSISQTIGSSNSYLQLEPTDSGNNPNSASNGNHIMHEFSRLNSSKNRQSKKRNRKPKKLSLQVIRNFITMNFY